MNRETARRQELIIERGMPLPETGRGRPCKYPWANMEVGDSVFIDTIRITTLSSAISYGKSHNMKFVSKVENQGRRIWRVK